MKEFREIPPELSGGFCPSELSRSLRDVAVLLGKGLQFVAPAPHVEVDWEALQQTNSNMPIWQYCPGIRIPPSSHLPSRLSLDNPQQRELIRRLTLSLDTTVFQAFKGSDVRFTPTSTIRGRFVKNSGVQKLSANSPVTIPHLQDIRRYLQNTLHAVPYEEGYLSLATPGAIRGFKDDSRFVSWRQYLKAGMVFYRGEVGQAGDIRVVEVTHSEMLASYHGGRGDLGEMLVFGNDPIVMLEEQAPELRVASLKRKPLKSLGWHGLLAFLEVVGPSTEQGRIVYVTG